MPLEVQISLPIEAFQRKFTQKPASTLGSVYVFVVAAVCLCESLYLVCVCLHVCPCVCLCLWTIVLWLIRGKCVRINTIRLRTDWRREKEGGNRFKILNMKLWSESLKAQWTVSFPQLQSAPLSVFEFGLQMDWVSGPIPAHFQSLLDLRATKNPQERFWI